MRKLITDIALLPWSILRCIAQTVVREIDPHLHRQLDQNYCGCRTGRPSTAARRSSASEKNLRIKRSDQPENARSTHDQRICGSKFLRP